MGWLAQHAAVFQEADVTLSTMGSRAWLVEAPGEFSLAAQRRIWSLAQILAHCDDVETLIPGVTNLLVLLKHTPEEEAAFPQRLREYWRQAREVSPQGRLIEIPVHYGGVLASDLAAVCHHTGLSEKEVIRRHYQGSYTVVALGSAPGFGYLHGLDPQLATPRKKYRRSICPRARSPLAEHRRGVGVDRSQRLERHRLCGFAGL